jgi:glycosyltransferase involved in cell wall biosynthesis
MAPQASNQVTLVRIAILSQYFPPEPAIKLSVVVPYLAAAGHDVQVLTSLPNLPHGKIYPGYRYCAAMREKLLGADVLRTFVWPYRGRTVWKRALHLISFSLSACIFGWQLRRFDLLYVYHPPLTICAPALLLAAVRGAPMLYDVQDLWPEAGLAAGAIERGVLYSLMVKCAGFTYARARHITVIAPEFKTILADGGVPPAKISVIPNWTDEQCFRPVPSTGVRARYGLPEDSFVVMYAGNFGSSHGFGVILEAAQRLQTNRDIVFAVSGSGAEYERSVELCNAMALTNVKFLGYVQSRADLPYLYAGADVMIVHLRRSPSGAVSLPSRLMAYMACGRPILACCEGAPRNLVEKAACGFGCEPENPARMADLIVNAKMNRENLPNMGASGRRYYLENFSEAGTLRKLSGLLDSLVPAATQ